MNTYVLSILILIILSATSCRKDVSYDSGSVTDSVPPAHDVVEKAKAARNIITDTLTEAEFIALFTEKERRAYNLSTDQDMKDVLEKSEAFWKNKGLIVGDRIKRLEFRGYPLSMRVQANGIKRIVVAGYGEAGSRVILYTVDKNYDIIGNCELSEQGGEAGESWRSGGEFVNDSIYHVVSYGYSEFDTTVQVMRARDIIHADGTVETIIDSNTGE